MITSTPPTRVLPADIFDALEFSALVHGGIGARQYFAQEDHRAPLCIIGHACFLDGRDAPLGLSWSNSVGGVERAVRQLGLCIVHENDNAVDRLADSEDPDARIPFDAWCQALGVVRGN